MNLVVATLAERRMPGRDRRLGAGPGGAAPPPLGILYILVYLCISWICLDICFVIFNICWYIPKWAFPKNSASAFQLIRHNLHICNLARLYDAPDVSGVFGADLHCRLHRLRGVGQNC